MLKRTSAIAILLMLSASLVLAQIPSIPQFSADMKMAGHDGHIGTGKMFWGGSKMRMDMNTGGRDVSLIHDMPRKTSYMIMPQQKMYMELSADNPMLGSTPNIKPYDPANPCAGEEGTTCKKVGAETINGRSCDKWDFKGPQGGQTVWIDQKLHFPIRNVASDGTTVDMTNVQEGSQPGSLFEVPAGFSKMDLGGMRGGRKKPE